MCTHDAKFHNLHGCTEIGCGCKVFMPGKVDRYLQILDEMRELHRKKSADYGGETGTDNLRASAEFGVKHWVYSMIRANEKMTRIKAFIRNGKLENESIEDSLMDIAAHAILSLVLYREETNDRT